MRLTRGAVKRRREPAVDSGARKPRALDVYSCWGGSTHFALEEGFEVIGSIDNDATASEAHQRIFPSVAHNMCDVRELKMEDIGDDLDLLMAWIPCSGTSDNSARFGHPKLGFDHDATGSSKRLFQLLTEMSGNYRKGQEKPMKPPKFVLIENPRSMLRAPANEEGSNGGFFRSLVDFFVETRRLAAKFDGLGYSHLEWLVLHSDVAVYHSPRAYVVAVRQDVAENIQHQGLVVLNTLRARLAASEQRQRGQQPGCYYCVTSSGERARAGGVGRMTSKQKGPFVVLQDKHGVGCGVFRFSVHAAAELHGLPQSFADVDVTADNNKFRLLGLSAVQSARRVLQCIKEKLALNSTRVSAGGESFSAFSFKGETGDWLQQMDDVAGTESFPDCGLVSIDSNGDARLYARVQQMSRPLTPLYRNGRSLKFIVDRWRGEGNRMLTALTLDEMEEHVRSRCKAFSTKGYSQIGQTDWHLKLISDVMAAEVKHAPFYDGQQLRILWPEHGGWFKCALLLKNEDFFVPHVRYDEGRSDYPSVLLPRTPQGGDVYHITANGVLVFKYKLAERSMRARVGMRDGEWMVKGILSDEEEEIDVAALFDEVRGQPVDAWRNVIDSRLKCGNHDPRHVCGICLRQFPQARGLATHHRWQHGGEESANPPALKARDACKSCQGKRFLKMIYNRVRG